MDVNIFSRNGLARLVAVKAKERQQRERISATMALIREAKARVGIAICRWTCGDSHAQSKPFFPSI